MLPIRISCYKVTQEVLGVKHMNLDRSQIEIGAGECRRYLWACLKRILKRFIWKLLEWVVWIFNKCFSLSCAAFKEVFESHIVICVFKYRTLKDRWAQLSNLAKNLRKTLIYDKKSNLGIFIGQNEYECFQKVQKAIVVLRALEEKVFAGRSSDHHWNEWG